LWSPLLAERRGDEDRVLTLPNVISFARILAVPYFVWLLLGADELIAAGLLLLAIGGTDWLDGYLARRLGQVSKLGKMLDPIADRLAIVTAVIAGWIAGILPGWLVVGLLVRESMVASLAVWLLLVHHDTIDVRWIGKLATFLLYGAIPGYYVAAAGFLDGVLRPLSGLVALIGLSLYWAVAVFYGADVRLAARKSLSSQATEEKDRHEHS
jgi:cardiolipin synthase